MSRRIDTALLPRPRRSCLYVPGANTRALEKAKSLPADVFILDLEDAVAPAAKADARSAILNAVGDRAYGTREVVIRVNGFETEWGRDDLELAAAAGVDGVLVPKISRRKDVRAINRFLNDAGASPDPRTGVKASSASTGRWSSCSTSSRPSG